jgi:two-component system sensor histidine kinase KdpD
MRFESGRVALRRDWQTADDLVGMALGRSAAALASHPVEVALTADLPQVQVDATLLLQLLGNLFDNIARHTPEGTPVRVSAAVERGQLRLDIADRGPGLPGGDPERLFAKFQRGQEESNAGGAGLGLAICRVIAEAHGGSISGAANPGGGAVFSLRLPLPAPQP